MQFFVLWGFVLWVIATGLFRWVGHYVVDPENPSSVVYMFVAAVPLVAFTTYPLYAWRRVAGRDRQAAAAPSSSRSPWSSSAWASPADMRRPAMASSRIAEAGRPEGLKSMATGTLSQSAASRRQGYSPRGAGGTKPVSSTSP